MYSSSECHRQHNGHRRTYSAAFTAIKLAIFNGIVLNAEAPIADALHVVNQAMFKRIAGRETTEGRPCQAAGAHVRPRVPLLPVGLTEDQVVTVFVVKSSAATLIGELAGRPLEMMLDSGSAVSLIIKEVADNLQDKLTNIPIPQVRLITASGEPLPIIGCVQAPVKIIHSQLEVTHQLLVVDRLVTPVILGLDFLWQHNLVINFASRPMTVTNLTQTVNQQPETIPQELQPVVKSAQQLKSKCVQLQQ